MRLAAALFIALFTAQFTAAQTDFTITRETFPNPLVGFGVEMNPYLYATPNWGGPVVFHNRLPLVPQWFRPILGDVGEDNVRDLERKIIALRPQHVRIFILLNWFALIGEDKTARGDPRMRQSLIRTVRLAQDAGATVNLTLWYDQLFGNNPELTGELFAKVLQYLIRDQHLTCIRYVTIQNEVNGEGAFGAARLTFDRYHRLYRSLDAGLRQLHLREQIQIVGGDLVGMNQTAWFADMAYHLSDILDAYSVHIYWDYWDTPKLLRRVSEVPPIVQSMPKEGIKPLYITEFGVRGFTGKDLVEPGMYWDFRPVVNSNLAALQCAWFVMEAINGGYVATVQWDAYDVWYDRRMGYGVIGEPGNGWALKPGYYALWLFTHTAGPGWRAIKVTGADVTKGVAAVQDPDGAMTVYASNHIERPQTIRISGLSPGQAFHCIYWNHDGRGHLSYGEPIRADDAGKLVVEMPAMSVMAMTDAPVVPWLQVNEKGN